MIRDARLKKGLTQLELAKAVGTSPQFICNIERGAGARGTPIPIHKIKSFAKTLDVPIRKFVDYQVAEYRKDINKKLGIR